MLQMHALPFTLNMHKITNKANFIQSTLYLQAGCIFELLDFISVTNCHLKMKHCYLWTIYTFEISELIILLIGKANKVLKHNLKNYCWYISS